MIGRKTILVATLGAAAIVAGSSAAFGQTCVGTPAGIGQFALHADLGFTDGARSWGGTLSLNLSSPLAFSAGYARTDFDDVDPSQNAFNGTAAFKLAASLPVEVCPVAGIGYSTLVDESTFFGEKIRTEYTSLSVPIGISVGHRVALRNGVEILPYAFPHALHIWSRVVESDPIGAFETSDSRTEFATTLGASVAFRSVFVRGSALVTTIDESDPTLSISLGLLLPNGR